MNDIAEASNINGVADLETLEFLRGVKSSTCLLLTPSPTTLDFKHPLSEEMHEGTFLTLNDDNKSVNNGTSDASAGDSSSSGDSNSVVQDPVSAQLINNISMLDYQTLSKNGDIIIGQPESKLNGSLSISNRKLPGFVTWNWGLIRRILLWLVLSGLVACIAAIITMVVTIPKTCNPDLPWYQGNVFYEIFPASFKDSNNDGIGDIKGILKKVDYIKELGGSAIRLNYIYEANDYPEHYYNTTSMLQIDRSIGVLKDFQDLVSSIHNMEMFIILDIPVLSVIDYVPTSISNQSLSALNDSVKNLDPTSAAIAFWCSQKVDGFYLKDLENFVENPNFSKSLQIWKFMLGSDKILMASEAALQKAKGESLTVLLNRVDLIDVHLDLNKGIDGLKNRIHQVVSGILWEKPHYPWVHWNIGNINSERISTKHTNNTLVLTALELVLPGTVGMFYGDEIGLGSLAKHEIEGDFHEHEHIHNLVPMSFTNNENSYTNGEILPWTAKSVLEPRYDYLSIIKQLIELRLETPTIYLKSIYKEGNILKNMEIRETEENLVVIERWYPRRNTCVFVGNLGNKAITTDLTAMFYGGTVVGGTNSTLIGQVIYFDKVTFPPNSAIILKLEK